MKVILAVLLIGSQALASGFFGSDPTPRIQVVQGSSITTSSSSAGQVVATYTVPIGRSFFLQEFDCNARLTTYASTATNFGNFQLNVPVISNGTYVENVSGIGQSVQRPVVLSTPLQIPYGVASGASTVTLTANPSSSTATNWYCNMVGYVQ